MPYMMRLQTLARRLKSDRKGLALIEFAFIAPILLLLVMTGLEIAHYAIAKLRIAQLARLAADVSGRYQPEISLTNIDDVISGVKKSGDGIDFAENGRVIISGLQLNAAGNGQWINWQRCAGAKNYVSTFGTEDQGYTNNTIQGMGKAGSTIAAPSSNMYIIFVELAYDYQPLLARSFIGTPLMTTSQAFIVRARQSGNLIGAFTMTNGSYNRSGGSGARTPTAAGNTIDNCSSFSA
jgi:hypothetical protein